MLFCFKFSILIFFKSKTFKYLFWITKLYLKVTSFPQKPSKGNKNRNLIPLKVHPIFLNDIKFLLHTDTTQLHWLFLKLLLTAIEIAISDSVTVSIGDDISGAFNDKFFVSGDLRLTSSAVKSIKPGSKRKSLELIYSVSKVARNV